VIVAQSGTDLQTLDQAGFMALVEPVLPVAYRLALAMLRSETEAEDVVQEAVLKAWRHRARFRRDAAMQPWLLAIVANECRAVRRGRWWSVVGWSGGTLQREEGSDDGAALRRAINALPHNQRLAVVLRYYLDLRFDEVGNVLGISTKAAKSRTYRALQRLRIDPEVIGDDDN
jgi:RNA polymerase sigma factor (sigma-70 family)